MMEASIPQPPIAQVNLKIGAGNFQEGFWVNLRLERDGHCWLDLDGRLPPAPELPLHWRGWQQAYGDRGLGNWRSYRALQAIESEVTHISIQSAAGALEDSLNRWLGNRDPQFQLLREALLDRLNQDDRIRFLIRIVGAECGLAAATAADREILWRLPWHLCDLFQRYPHAETVIGLPPRTYLPSPPRPTRRVRILAILSEATDIDVQADLELLRDRLPATAEILPPLVATSRDRIHRALWDERIDILFFAGHSSSTAADGRFYLNARESLAIRDLKYALQQAIAKGLKLAIFNSCDGLQLAQDLADLQMPAIAVMRERIPDEAAQQFLDSFLTAFARDDKPLAVAIREARERLQGLESHYPCASWLPVLCQHPEAAELTWAALSTVPAAGQTPKAADAVAGRRRWRQAVPVLGVLGVAIAALSGLPELSRHFNRTGARCLNDSDLNCAKSAFAWSLRLNPWNDAAMNNLGVTYRDLGELATARDYFRRAKLQGNLAACNQQARLDILAGQVDLAEDMLVACLAAARQEERPLVEFAIRHNLGWALLAQDEAAAAESMLRQAIALLAPANSSANCLLAQALDAQGQRPQAIPEWRACLDARDDIPEAVEWQRQAEAILENQR